MTVGIVCALGAGCAVAPGIAEATRASESAAAAGAAERLLFVSPDGSDEGTCRQKRPCRSFDRAYRVAKPGQAVEVAGGTYPTQELQYATKTSSNDVVFRPKDGARVVVDGDLVARGAQHVTFENLHATSYDAVPSTGCTLDATTKYALDVTFRGGSTNLFYTRAAEQVAFLDLTVGNYRTSQVEGVPTIGSCEEMPPSRNIVIDRVWFKGIVRDSDQHAECLYLQDVDGLIIRNSRFQNCPVIGIFANAVGNPRNPKHVLIENNWIDVPVDGNQAIKVKQATGTDSPTSWTIRHNSLGSQILFDTTSAENIVVKANVGRNYEGSCFSGSGVHYERNVFSTAKCGATDKVAAPGFADEAGFDYHLVRGAAAIAYGDPVGYPATDIDGHRRPRRSAPDAGANQRESVLIVPGKSIGAVRLGMSEAEVREFYGRPRAVRTVRPRGTGPRLRVARYPAHGGQLLVMYDGTKVVGVSTTSPYYATRAGLGPGIDMPAPGGLAWVECRRAYRRSLPGAALYVVPSGGAGGKTVAEISLLKSGYPEC